MFHSLGSSPKILLVRLRSLGDVVLMTPLLESILRERPDAAIDVAVEHPFNDVLHDHPFIHRLLEFESEKPEAEDSPNHPRSSRDRKLLRRPGGLWSIRRAHYDLVWNLHGGTTSAWLTGLSGALYRVGCRQFRNRWAYNLQVPDSAEILGRRPHHTVERGLAWFDWLRGVERSDFSDAPPLRIVVSESAVISAIQKLRLAGIVSGSPYVVIQPAAVFATKEWMPDRFANCAEFLFSMGFQVVLSGSPQDRPKLEQVKSHMQSPAALCSNLSVKELAAVLQGCCLFLGNDSGPAHLAAAFKKPTVVLFGSSNSAAWAPWGTNSVVVQNPYDCNPCPGYSCGKYLQPECIRSITVDQVKAAIQQILQQAH